MKFCTVISRSYLPFARALAASVRRYEPAAGLVVLILDDADHEIGASEGFEVVRPTDLDVLDQTFQEMATIYDVTELATAVKPLILKLLLERGARCAVYLDPDILLFGPLTGLADLAQKTEMVLTLHSNVPIPLTTKNVSEYALLNVGAYNLGFIAVGQGSTPFLGWWEERLRRDCINEVTLGLFVDQRWADLGSRLFTHHAIRDDGYNVAYWNLENRVIAWHGSDSYTSNGSPLAFFHFSGIDPHHPDRISRHLESFEGPLAVSGSVRRLCRDYSAQLLGLEFDHWSEKRYAYDTSADGLWIDTFLRRAYRSDLISGARNLPNPFSVDEAAAFRRWASARALERFGRQVNARISASAKSKIRGIIQVRDSFHRSRARASKRPGG